MDNKETLTICPQCRKYLGRKYHYCTQCGIDLTDKELLVMNMKEYYRLEGGKNEQTES